MTSTIRLAQDPEADRLLTDNAFALLLGMQLDQQVPMEKAFTGPHELARRLCEAGRLDGVEALSAELVAGLPQDELIDLFRRRPALHRFPEAMAKRAHQLAVLLVEQYGGDVERFWSEPDTGEQLLTRLKQLPGFGDGKARIFLGLLGKQRGITPTGWREAAGPFGAEDTTISVADIVDEQSLIKVREHKKAMKQAAKVAG
ncbi:MAG TPA: HhH-GPD-type base excision DNA repair protein [Mycobacteriales bacterium]|jgi:uncharacterized HhH-GPD family protein|nr:HhH-GPD-type base excision DNA repair protein [Mycobacteriales bacterium]